MMDEHYQLICTCDRDRCLEMRSFQADSFMSARVFARISGWVIDDPLAICPDCAAAGWRIKGGEVVQEQSSEYLALLSEYRRLKAFKDAVDCLRKDDLDSVELPVNWKRDSEVEVICYGDWTGPEAIADGKSFRGPTIQAALAAAVAERRRVEQEKQ